MEKKQNKTKQNEAQRDWGHPAQSHHTFDSTWVESQLGGVWLTLIAHMLRDSRMTGTRGKASRPKDTVINCVVQRQVTRNN